MMTRRSFGAPRSRLRMIGCLAIGLGSAAAVNVAVAQPAKPATEAAKERGAKEELRITLEQAIARVRAAGYTDIEEIEREGGGYEVCAKDAKGKEVDLKVDGRTGEIKVSEDEDDA